jgi:hypothetical protein
MMKQVSLSLLGNDARTPKVAEKSVADNVEESGDPLLQDL